jgi:hypothetical protein
MNDVDSRLQHLWKKLFHTPYFPPGPSTLFDGYHPGDMPLPSNSPRPPVVKKKTKTINTITIYTRHITKSWKVDYNSKHGVMHPWLNFYKWWFNKSYPTPQYYVFTFDVGQTMLRREDILWFEVLIEEETI